MNWLVNVFDFQMVKKKDDHCDNDIYDDAVYDRVSMSVMDFPKKVWMGG